MLAVKLKKRRKNANRPKKRKSRAKPNPYAAPYRRRFHALDDIRQYLQFVINQMNKGKMTTQQGRAHAYVCNTLMECFKLMMTGKLEAELQIIKQELFQSDLLNEHSFGILLREKMEEMLIIKGEGASDVQVIAERNQQIEANQPD